MASLCPLGRRPDQPGPEHFHDPCQCLDSHDWDATHTCMTCGVARCEHTRTQGIVKKRCTRMRSHGKWHRYDVRRRFFGSVNGG